jgi:CBS domain containing-hemolysin-like protein
MRGFMWLTRPALRALNSAANGSLRLAGLEPADQLASGQNADDLRQLVEHSAEVGSLDAEQSQRLGDALDLRALTVGDLLRPGAVPTAVPQTAYVASVRAATRSSGHLRILLGRPDAVAGVVHVRDTLDEPDGRPAADLMRPVLSLPPDTPVYTALATMRETRNHLAVVDVAAGAVGVITMDDVLTRLFPHG